MGLFKRKPDRGLEAIERRWQSQVPPDFDEMAGILRPHVQRILGESGTSDDPCAATYALYWMRIFVAFPIQHVLDVLKPLPHADDIRNSFEELYSARDTNAIHLFAWWLNLSPDLFHPVIETELRQMADVLGEKLAFEKSTGVDFCDSMSSDPAS